MSAIHAPMFQAQSLSGWIETIGTVYWANRNGYAWSGSSWDCPDHQANGESIKITQAFVDAFGSLTNVKIGYTISIGSGGSCTPRLWNTSASILAQFPSHSVSGAYTDEAVAPPSSALSLNDYLILAGDTGSIGAMSITSVQVYIP